VGNKAFADYVDANLSLTHINNMEDFVPIIPGEFLGYTHPAGEVHIQDSGAWLACPGWFFFLLFFTIFIYRPLHVQARIMRMINAPWGTYPR